jgi:hypothetical protein
VTTHEFKNRCDIMIRNIAARYRSGFFSKGYALWLIRDIMDARDYCGKFVTFRSMNKLNFYENLSEQLYGDGCLLEYR